MGKAELLRDLREQVGSVQLEEKEFWTAPGFPNGIAKGIVVELMGNAKTEWLLSFFNLHPELYIFWCEREIKINPTAIKQRGVGLDRIKFVTSNDEDIQATLRLALESKFYPFVVAPNRFSDIKIYQRFQFLSGKSKGTLFLLADHKFSAAWPIALQLHIRSSPDGFQIEVERQKHGGRS